MRKWELVFLVEMERRFRVLEDKECFMCRKWRLFADDSNHSSYYIVFPKGDKWKGSWTAGRLGCLKLCCASRIQIRDQLSWSHNWPRMAHHVCKWNSCGCQISSLLVIFVFFIWGSRMDAIQYDLCIRSNVGINLTHIRLNGYLLQMELASFHGWPFTLLLIIFFICVIPHIDNLTMNLFLLE